MSEIRWPSADELLCLAIDQADGGARVDHVLERAFLGGVICGSDGPTHYVHFLLAPGDFFDLLHAAIWGACLRLRAAGRLVEQLNVMRELVDIPAAVQRVAEIVANFADGEDGLAFLLHCTWRIKQAAVHRAAAKLAARTRRVA